MRWIINNINRKWHIKKIVGLGFGFALLISVLSSIVSYLSTNQVLKATNELSNSHLSYGILKEILSVITYAESCERAYVITSSDEYLNSYHESALVVKLKIQELKELTKDHSRQFGKIELLEPLISERFDIMEEVFQVKKNSGYQPAIELVLSHKPKIIMNSIREILGNMEIQERESLETGTIIAKIYSDRIKTIIIIGNLITFIVLSASLIVIFMDISHRNYFEQELIKAKEIAEKSVQVKEHFLANVSHEIRTPMNAISGLTKILLKSEVTINQKEYLDAIKTSSDILLVIINDILDLSKAGAGKMVFEKTDFKIHNLISSITDLLHSKAEEKNLKLINHFDKNIPDLLIGDPVRLNQIILNLVSNAIKFTEKGEISLITKILEQDKNTVTIKFTIKDTGIGIAAEKLPTIFESFTQASTEITRKYGGTGLGLNIVKELVELQNGIVSVESKLGIGSVFSFILKFPTVPNNHFDFINKKVEKTKIMFKEIQILLVEDNIINQLLAQTVLLDFGFKVDVADNGMTALKLLNEKRYDIVLMDIQMPEMSGYEVTQHIRKNVLKPWFNIPILAMTANASQADADKCMQVGMDGYISKPFDEQMLFNQICTLISKKSNLENDYFTEKSIDLNYLRSLSKGDDNFIKEIIMLFIQQTPVAIDNMKRHYENKNWELLMAEAHKIKPSFGFIGGIKLVELAREIENFSSKKVNSNLVSKSILDIETICNNAYEELQNELILINMNLKQQCMK
ncbi:MAG: response regulator [Bacteroidetes bacterium]|nr:response regulator [Bacteroidota bacterium]HET6244316.1 response regulator [Bacteroidia bacterium]